MSKAENPVTLAEKHVNLFRKNVVYITALGLLLMIAPAILAGRCIRSKLQQERPMADKIRSSDYRLQ